jgi:hypothetical protein
LKKIPWEGDTISKITPSTEFSFDPVETDCLLERLDPLDYYRRFSAFNSSSFLTPTTESSVRKQVLVAAADLKATFKAARSTQLSITDGQPYVYHTVDDAKIRGHNIKSSRADNMPFELPPSATKHATLPDPEVPSQRNNSPIPPEPPPTPIRSSSEGDVVIVGS